MILLRIVFVVAVVTLLFLAQAVPVEAKLHGAWPDLNMTYRLTENCAVVSYRAEPILGAFTLWKNWLPESNWIPVSENERLRFDCYGTPDLPWSNIAGSARCYSEDENGNPRPFNNTIGFWIQTWCIILLAERIWDPASYGCVNSSMIVAHEIGQALGLIVNTGGLMSPGMNLPPTPEQLDEIRAATAAVTVPEFPIPTPLIWFLIALFAFWTPLMRRRRVKTNA